MHWLEERVKLLYHSELQYLENRRNDTAVEKGLLGRRKDREFRASFLNEIKQLVQAVSEVDGISGCIACHDGLLVAKSGKLSDFEAVAAAAQECITYADKSTVPLQLGRLRQISIIGERAKLALVVMGDIAVGIVSPVETILSQVLRDPGS